MVMRSLRITKSTSAKAIFKMYWEQQLNIVEKWLNGHGQFPEEYSIKCFALSGNSAFVHIDDSDDIYFVSETEFERYEKKES